MPPPEPVTLPAPDPASPPATATRPSAGRWRAVGRRLAGTTPVQDRIGVAICALIGLVHVAVVWPTYHVGSFDDDASYVMTARALAHLHGLTSTLPVGLPLASTYPSGYPALLTPLAAIGGHATLPMRVLSGVLLLLVFPLTWTYLRSRGFGRGFGYVVLAMLALNPVTATYGSMVMAEVPFVLAFVLTLIALERWADQRTTWTLAGGSVIVLLPALVWLKEAGIGIAAGALLYLLCRREFRKALAALAGLVALVLPLLIARLISSTPLLGSRYSSEIGGSDGSLWHRVTTIPPQAISLYWHWAVPDTIVPTTFKPFSTVDWLQGTLTVVRLSVAPIVLLGIVGWIVRMHRGRTWRTGGLDAAIWTVGVYFLETLLYPYTNERRVVLVLPVALAWAVLGVKTLGELIAAAVQRLRAPRPVRPIRVGAAVVAVAVAIPLIWQFPRNYMLPMGRSTSAPGSSPSMALLRRLGQPSDVVETDYVWATSLFSGHRARNGFFQSCSDENALAAAFEDHAGYVLTSGFASIGIGSPCALRIASRTPSAVRLYRTTRDSTAVFALVGPGTTKPEESDLTGGQPPDASAPVTQLPEPEQLDEEAGSYATTPSTHGTATLTWNFVHPGQVQQVSIGAASATTTRAVDLEIRTVEGRWLRVAHADGPVGEGQRTPFLLTVLEQPINATAMRVVITGTGTAQVHDAHALGIAS